MMNSGLKNKKVFILTELPMLVGGNQSLYRFTKLLGNAGAHLTVFKSNYNVVGAEQREVGLIDRINIPTVSGLFRKATAVAPEKDDNTSSVSIFVQLRSSTRLTSIGKITTKVVVRNWVSFIAQWIDNVIMLIWVFWRIRRGKPDLIVGYEIKYTFASQILSRILSVPYVNKFQGTALVSFGTELARAKFSMPGHYYGINASDLCLMVNDGTRGDYYARARGCRSIRFAAHGVGHVGTCSSQRLQGIDQVTRNRIFIFNNASGSIWKRPDRLIRFFNYLKPDTLKKISLVSSYYGPGLSELREMKEELPPDALLIFSGRLTQEESYSLLLKCDFLMMTNDLSNLGNPVLEAVYNGVPIISLNDGSLDGYVLDRYNGLLVDVNENFDSELAARVEQAVVQVDELKTNAKCFAPGPVEELAVAQQTELEAICATLRPR